MYRVSAHLYFSQAPRPIPSKSVHHPRHLPNVYLRDVTGFWPSQHQSIVVMSDDEDDDEVYSETSIPNGGHRNSDGSDSGTDGDSGSGDNESENESENENEHEDGGILGLDTSSNELPAHRDLNSSRSTTTARPLVRSFLNEYHTGTAGSTTRAAQSELLSTVDLLSERIVAEWGESTRQEALTTRPSTLLIHCACATFGTQLSVKSATVEMVKCLMMSVPIRLFLAQQSHVLDGQLRTGLRKGLRIFVQLVVYQAAAATLLRSAVWYEANNGNDSEDSDDDDTRTEPHKQRLFVREFITKMTYVLENQESLLTKGKIVAAKKEEQREQQQSLLAALRGMDVGEDSQDTLRRCLEFLDKDTEEDALASRVTQVKRQLRQNSWFVYHPSNEDGHEDFPATQSVQPSNTRALRNVFLLPQSVLSMLEMFELETNSSLSQLLLEEVLDLIEEFFEGWDVSKEEKVSLETTDSWYNYREQDSVKLSSATHTKLRLIHRNIVALACPFEFHLREIRLAVTAEEAAAEEEEAGVVEEEGGGGGNNGTLPMAERSFNFTRETLLEGSALGRMVDKATLCQYGLDSDCRRDKDYVKNGMWASMFVVGTHGECF